MMASHAEHQIRQAVLHNIYEQHNNDSSTVVVQEFGVRHGCGRVDIAVFNGSLEAFEIKSDNDTLIRLERQIRLFASVFDTLTIVCGRRHAQKVLDVVPAWCGVVSVENKSLFALRRADKSPMQEPAQLVKLLHRQEVAAALGARRQPARSSESRRQLFERLLGILDTAELRQVVLAAIKQRAGASQRRCGD